MLIRKSEQIIFAFLVGALCGLCVSFFADDFRARAESGEPRACRDEPDSRAYMARLPGEAHTTEACLHAFRFGSPRWVPDFQSPLKPRREGE